ncbi:MAG: VWA domain-containing protein [Hyphomicrobium sp.]
MSGRIEGIARQAPCLMGVRNVLAEFCRDRSGDIAALFGLMAILMFLMMGAAIDYSRWLHARNQTMAAIDSAVLAAGSHLKAHTSDEAGAMEIADTYYDRNVKKRLPLLTDTISFKTEDNGLSVTAEGTAFIATTFLRLAGINQLPLFELSGAEYSKAVLAAGSNAGKNIEVALMLDTSGSMDDNNKLEDMQEAASDLVDILIWDDQSQFTSKVSLAPFSADMRVPSAYLDAVRGAGPFLDITVNYSCWNRRTGFTTCTTSYEVTPCVVERTQGQKYTDAAPKIGMFVTAGYTSSGNCSQPADNSMMPLTSNKTTLKNHINGMDLGGGTAGHLGTAWAWYTLSPEWNTVWPSNPAASYDAPNTEKIAILMTDGEYNTQYDAQGLKVGWTGSGAAANGTSRQQAENLCDGMKDKGITVYTVGFDLGGNQSAIETLQNCASSADKFYNAENGDDLKQAFKDIALRLSDLYLTR